MEENKNTLDELSKGCCMGMDAIHFILDKVHDEKFKSDLTVQYEKYKEMEAKIREMYPKYVKSDEESPRETSAINKAMTWYGIEMKTLTDESNSKIAELLLTGTNMGIIEGRKLLNKKDMCEEIHQITSEYVTMQEDSVEQLKKYL